MSPYALIAAVAVVSVVVAGLVLRWRRAERRRASTFGIGPVSEGWLAEQRGRKDV